MENEKHLIPESRCGKKSQDFETTSGIIKSALIISSTTDPGSQRGDKS
jgi:hypothetical protein